MEDYYAALNIDRSATQASIARAYEKVMLQLQHAYEVLSDPTERAQYDREYAARQSQSSATRPHQTNDTPGQTNVTSPGGLYTSASSYWRAQDPNIAPKDCPHHSLWSLDVSFPAQKCQMSGCETEEDVALSCDRCKGEGCRKCAKKCMTEMREMWEQETARRRERERERQRQSEGIESGREGKVGR